MKHRFIGRAGLRRLTGRLPTAAGKSLDLLVAVSPFLIQTLRLLQRRYNRRSQQLAHRPKPDAAGENHEPPGDDLTAQSHGILPGHPPGDQPELLPVRDRSTE